MRFPHRLAAVLLPFLALAGLLVHPALSAGPDRHRGAEYPELEGKPVRRIIILGNNRTRELVFRREMRLEEGAPFRAGDLWRDRDRIVDLGLFAEVEADAVPSGDGVLVVVSVHERPSWIAAPVANYDLEDRRVSVGYRARLRNLGGMNRTLRSSGRVGVRDRFTVSWETPWLGETRQTLLLSVDVEPPRTGEDELRTSGASVTTSRFLGDYKRVRRAVTFFGRLEVLDRDGTHPEGPVHQLSPVVGLGWSRDARNVRVDPDRGTFSSAFGELISGWTDDDLSYGRTTLDGRGFLSIGRGVVVASRLLGIFTTGEVPTYRRLGVGGDNSIRGQPDNIAIGDNAARGSFEVRFPILPRRRFVLPIPLVPKRISNVDLRVDGEVFVDAGTAWNDFRDAPDARVRTGAGFGLRLFMPIVEVARLEVAFDESGKARFYLSEGNLI